MITAKQICDHLGGREVNGSYECKCPAHDDNTASLSLKQDGDKLLMNCFAGCSFESIMQSLERSGLSNKIEKKTLVTIKYDYLDEHGKYLYTKHKRKGGIPPYWITRGKIKGLGDIKPVLYRLPDLIKADTIFIVEGEKDVETLRLWGLTATCNFDGAGTKKWREEYNQYFIGKNVHILSDNDLIGRTHALNIMKNLIPVAKNVVFLDGRHLGVAEKGDITDAIESGLTLEQFYSLLTSDMITAVLPKGETNESLMSGEEGSEGPRKAKYEDYVRLFVERLGVLKRDIFSGALMYQDSRFWKPVANCEKMLRSEATQKTNGSMKYSPNLVGDHLAFLEHISIPQLLFSIPEWDGVPRISVFAGAMKPHPSQGFSTAMVDYLLKDWLVNAIKRVANPYHQNRILILHGKQGIGKDRFSDSLLCGAGQWYKPLSVMAGDKDTFLQPSKAMFLKISEFDKTSKMEVSLLKDLITTPTTDIRASYGRESEVRESRASFIAGCNVGDILRDHTGARRYVILELSDLPAEFPVMDISYSLQTFAEAKKLAAEGWKQVPEYEKILKEYLKDKTPDDPADDILQMFAHECNEWAKVTTDYEFQDFATNGRIMGVTASKMVQQTAKALGIKPRQVQLALSAARLRVKSGNLRGYIVPGIKKDKEKADDLPALFEH